MKTLAKSLLNIGKNFPQQIFGGIGFTLKKQDTVFIERLHLQTDQGNIYYIPEVAHNATPIYFKISEYSNTGFTAENPNHDFPKKINYQKTEKGMESGYFRGW